LALKRLYFWRSSLLCCADITAEELLKAVKSLKNKKCCCSDCITNEMIKVSCTLYYNLDFDIFNLILRSGIYPSIWFRNFQHIIKQFGSKTSIFLTEQFIMLLFLI
jgi:hypothetical protein